MLRARWHAMILMTCALGGCDANQLYLAYQTNIGVHAAVNPAQTEGTLVVGYRRDFATVVPRSVPIDANYFADTDPPSSPPPSAGPPPSTAANLGQRDAMSVMMCSELQINGIWLRGYTESLATGVAARRFARGLGAELGASQTEDFFACFKKSKVDGAAPTQAIR